MLGPIDALTEEEWLALPVMTHDDAILELYPELRRVVEAAYTGEQNGWSVANHKELIASLAKLRGRVEELTK